MFNLSRYLHQGKLLPLMGMLALAAIFITPVRAASPADSVEASTAAMGPGRPMVATFSDTPPQPLFATPKDKEEFDRAIAKMNRGGPVALPYARPRMGETLGPEQRNPMAPVTNPGALYVATRLVNPTGASFSPVNEPSGDNAGLNRFQSGNWYAAKSADAGSHWSYVNPFTMFGSGFCCDQVVIYDPGRNLWFWLLQYTDGHLVLANSNDLVNWCSYTWTPASFGFTGELDYNDLALTTNYIYIASNIFPAAGGSGSMIARLPIDAQQSCAGFSFNFFTRTDLGFTWKPVSGANDVMYWGTNWFGTLGSSFRIFKWPENTGTVSWFDRTLGTTFGFYTRNSGQNCASADGVVKNWCQFGDSRVLGGARYSDPNGVQRLVFSFNAKQDGSHPFPYTNRVHFNEYDMSYIGTDQIWAGWGAFAYTSMATDARGHIGMTTLWGGGTGTTHYYPGGAILLNDDVSPTQPWQIYYNASGAGNPCTATGGISRTGDYTTTRPYRPTNDAFLGYNWIETADAGACGTAASVSAYEVWFGRKRDRAGANNRWK